MFFINLPIGKLMHDTIYNAVTYCKGVRSYWGVEGKGRLWVLQHCCLGAYCTLTRMSSFIHLQRRYTHTKRRERPLLVKEGTISGI